MVIGGAAGLVGGGAAGTIAKYGTQATRAALPTIQNIGNSGVQNVARAAVGSMGQRAVSGGLQQASSNTLDYGINGENRNLGGYVHAFGSGFATGAGGSVFAGKLAGELRLPLVNAQGVASRAAGARQREHGPRGQPRCRSGTVRGQRSRATQR